jgi:hypothetical protein
MAQSGGGSTTRHIIEVMYQVTGLDKAGAGITSLNKSVTTGQTSLDKFGMSATKASTETTKLDTSLRKVPTTLDKTSQSTTKLDASQVKAGKSAQSLADKFRGNKGLIFSTTMLSSGVVEAIGMFQGWTDASEKLGAAQEKVAELEARGMENTKEYGQAVKEASDAQRGYNFITRFTIQSFGDLIPMSLMMVSSLTDLSGKFMEGASAKEKFAAVGSKVVGALKAVGTAMTQLSTRNVFLLLILAITAAITAVMANFGGLRDRINEVGVMFGKAVPQVKGFLDWIGQLGNSFSISAAEAMGYSQKTTKSLQDVEGQVLRTGDATKLSIEDQIVMYAKLGDEAESVSFSLSAHLKMQQQDQDAHKQKYSQFVDAMQSGDQEIIDSMGLTAEEFKTFYKEWQEAIKEFDDTFSGHVDKVAENYQKFGELGREAQTGMIEEMDKLNKKITEHYQKREDGEKMDKKARKEWKKELKEMQGQYSEFADEIISGAEDSARAWAEFEQVGKTTLDNFAKEALSGNFNNAVTSITNAMDQVPPKYKQQFDRIKPIIENPMISAAAKVDAISAQFSRVNPFKSLTVGVKEYTLEQANLLSGLDELGVAARANVTDVDQMGAAFNNFVASMKPAQRELPIVQSAMELLEKGAITASEAFAMVEGAGRDMSATLGDTVTESFDDLKKTIVDLPGPTSAVFAEIGGQIVKVGEVTDESLVSGPKSATKSMTKVGDEVKTLEDLLGTELTQNATLSVEAFATGSGNAFDTVITSMAAIGTEAAKIPAVLKKALDTQTITKAWDAFRNALGETGTWVNTGVTQIASHLKGAITIQNFKEAWTGFWQAVGEGQQIIKSAISTLAKVIAEDIRLKALSQEWWKGFWDAMSGTVTWVGQGIAAIGAEILKTIQTESPGWWVGFQKALYGTLTWVSSGIQTIGAQIANTIVKESPNWWIGFQDALYSTGTWIKTQITSVGKAITAEISVTNATKWWVGFQNALYSTGAWIKTQITSIGKAITAEINVNNATKWWKGFQDALYSSGAWIKTQITSVGKAITAEINIGNATKWWVGFQKALGSSTTWVATEIKKVADAILKWAGWKTLGADIWKVIAEGITGALSDAGNLLSGLLGKIPGLGDIIQGAEASTGKQVSKEQADKMMEQQLGGGGKGLETAVTADPFAKVLPMAIKSLDQLKAYVNTTTTQISSFFVVMETSIKATIGRIGTGFTTAFTPLQTHATQITSQTSAAFVTMEASIKGTMTRIAAIFPTAFTQLYTFAAQSTGQTIQAFVVMQTQIQGIMSKITMLFQPAFANLAPVVTQATSQASVPFTTMESSIRGTLSRITILFNPAFASLPPIATQNTTNASAAFMTMQSSIQATLNRISALFPPPFKTLEQTAIKSTTTASASFSTMNKSVGTSLQNMTTKVQSFGKASSKSFDETKRSADQATKSVQALQKAINALKNKTVTITQKFTTSGTRYVRHGGSFISMDPTGFAAGGQSWINTKPRKIGGMNISEFGKPELVTVTPLSNPNDPMDRNMSIGLPKTPQPIQSSMNKFGANPITGGSRGNGNQPIQVTGNVYVTVKTQNGKVLAQEVQPYLLQDFGGIT